MKICKIEGCERKHKARGYCVRHYNQIRLYGKIIGHPQRTHYTPNKFIIKGNTCKIELYDRYGNHRAIVIIDAEDYDKVKDRKWKLSRGYVIEGKTGLRLYRLIMGKIKEGFEPDHRDGDKLNNRKQNLRICTHAENGKNQCKPTNNTSGYKGVSWNKRAKKWMVYIKKNGKPIYLGYFISLIEAALAYNKAALEHHGEFARLNEI